MSYILDALKKSEQARQQSAPVSHYSLWPVVDEEAGQKRLWPYGIAVLVAANALLVGYWLRPALPAESHAETPPIALAKPAPVEKEQIAAVAPARTVSDGAVAPAVVAITTDRAAPEPVVATHSSPVVETTPQLTQRVSSKPGGSELKAAAAVAETGRSAAKRALKERNAIAAAGPATQAKPTVEATPKAAQAPDRGVKKSEPNETVKVANAAPASQAVPQQNGKTEAAAQANATVAKASDPAKDTANRDELPAALQKELPVLAVSGFIRDGDAEGMVIVNDRLVRAGDEVAPGVKLEKIVKDNLVFSYKGYRFTR